MSMVRVIVHTLPNCGRNENQPPNDKFNDVTGCPTANDGAVRKFMCEKSNTREEMTDGQGEQRKYKVR